MTMLTVINLLTLLPFSALLTLPSQGLYHTDLRELHASGHLEVFLQPLESGVIGVIGVIGEPSQILARQHLLSAALERGNTNVTLL
jgi:hypothetical protein